VKTLGKTSFVGVVSDGMYGASAQDLIGPLTSTVAAKYTLSFYYFRYIFFFSC
jgi:hypothetical protein